MDAVLFHNKERRRHHRRSSSKSYRSDSSKSYRSDSEDDRSAVFEKSQNAELLDLVQRKKWESLMYPILKEPHTSYVKFTSRSSAGNLLLHEACKRNAPMDIIEALIESNEKAAMVKGNAGYLPFHYACAYGAPIELIRFLHSVNPDAVRTPDDEESILPLHLACKAGNTKEDVYMLLLTAYPESSMIRDDYGRLPIDYAKSIRSDSHRNVAIECLKRAKWLEIAANESKKRTESDFHQRIKGYEQAQGQQLQMIEEVHTKEVADLEAKLEAKDEELAERSQDLEELDKHLQEMTDEFRQRVEAAEKANKAKNRKLQAQLDKANEETADAKAALASKVEEIDRLCLKLDEARNKHDSLNQQLEQSNKELDLALEDIETLTKHTEWLQSIKESIHKLATSESPALKDLSRSDSSKKSNRGSSKKPKKSRGSSVSSRRSEKKKSRDSSVCSRRSEKLKYNSSYRIAPGNPESMADDDERDPSFSSRVAGTQRE